MNSRPSLARVWPVLTASLFWLLAAAVAAEPGLSVSGNTHQGSALFVRVLELEEFKGATVRWDGADYPLGDRGEAVLPISIDTKGQQTLKVSLADGQQLERSFKVSKRNFGHQSISLNPTTLASYDDPRNKADDKKILKSLEDITGERLWNGDFNYPVEAPQTTGFGLRRTYNGWKKGWHKGLDLAGWEGQPVLAPAAGRVVHTARGLVNGNTVVVDHGLGVGSVYMHLLDIAVREGQTVKQGQQLGRVGGTGGFAPHLHWEVRVHGVPVHPKTFFNLPRGWR